MVVFEPEELLLVLELEPEELELEVGSEPEEVESEPEGLVLDELSH